MTQDIYTNIHFIDHFHVNIDSKQSVVKEYPSNVPQFYPLIYHSCGLSTATIKYLCLSVCLSVCLCILVHHNSNGSVHLKLEHIVENNSSNEFDIGYCPSKF